MKRKCVIIPCFNEEKNIVSVIEGIKIYCDTDIVVIDDGSRDLTAEMAEKAGAYVVRHLFNMGYGAALQTGYKYALQNRYDVLVQIDGDGQHSARFIPEFFRIEELNHFDVIIGSRFLGQNDYKVGFCKFAAIRLFRYIIRLATGERITDPTSGYQCLNRRAFQYFTRDNFPYDYPDANEIIMLLRSEFKIKEIPVEMMPNPQGRSMHRGFMNITYYFFRVFLSIFITLIRKS